MKLLGNPIARSVGAPVGGSRQTSILLALESVVIGGVDPSTVVVTFSRPIMAQGDDYLSGWDVRVDSVAATINTATRQSNQAVLYLALASPVTSTAAVTIAYSV